MWRLRDAVARLRKSLYINLIQHICLKKVPLPFPPPSLNSTTLPFQQALEEIKTITITLQLPRPPRPHLPTLPINRALQLLNNQQPPLPRHPPNPRPNSPLILQRNNLSTMQPSLIIHILKHLIEPRAAEAGVEFFELDEDGWEQFFEAEGGEVGGGGEGGEGEGGGGVVGV